MKRRVEKITTARENGKRKADIIAAEDTDDDESASSKPAGRFDKRAKRDGRDGRDRRDRHDGPGGREGLKGNFRGKQGQDREQGGKFDRERPRGGQNGPRRDYNDRGGRNERGGRNDRGDRPGQVQPRQPGRRDQKSVNQVKKDVKTKEAGEKRGIEKFGSQLGSMIGRKRKMRKGAK